MGTTYSVRQLKETMAYCKRYPYDGKIRVHFAPDRPVFTSAEWRQWFRDRLMARINRGLPSRGRKDCAQWYWEQWRASRDLNRPRLIIDWLPKDLAQRFPHRLRRNRHDLN